MVESESFAWITVPWPPNGPGFSRVARDAMMTQLVGRKAAGHVGCNPKLGAADSRPSASKRHTIRSMPFSYRMTLDDGEGDRAVIAGELSDADTVTLNRFLDQYEELVDSKPVREGVDCEVTISVNKGKATVDAKLPTRDELDILFQRLRLFLLQKERASFVNVCSILRKQFTDLRLVELIKDQHAAFHNHPDHLGSVLIVNELAIDRERMLMDWIYGYQFHGEDERRDRLRAMGIDVNSPLIRQTLVSLLLNKQDALTNIAAVVAVLMRRCPVVDLYGALLSRDPSNE
jgi:hypothetical protein